MCREEIQTLETEKDLWSRITVVTDRKLAIRPFLDQMEILCQKGPERILLREKDLDLPEYEKLAEEVKKSVTDTRCLFTAIPTRKRR